LADKYITEKAVSSKFYEDALHIAIATTNQVNVLASWKFKHIVKRWCATKWYKSNGGKSHQGNCPFTLKKFGQLAMLNCSLKLQTSNNQAVMRKCEPAIASR